MQDHLIFVKSRESRNHAYRDLRLLHFTNQAITALKEKPRLTCMDSTMGALYFILILYSV